MAICGNISLFVAHLEGRGRVGREEYLPPIDEECNISCLFSFVVKKKMFCDFFNQNLKSSISWAGFAVRLSVCPSVLPSLLSRVSWENSRDLCLACVWICFVLFSFRFAFALAFICCLLSICVCFGLLSFPLFFVGGQCHKATIAVIIISRGSSSEAASSSWGRAQGCLVIHGWWYSRN